MRPKTAQKKPPAILSEAQMEKRPTSLFFKEVVVFAGFFCALSKKNSGSKKLRFLPIFEKTQVKNRDFRVTLLNKPPKKTQVQRQKTQGLDQ